MTLRLLRPWQPYLALSLCVFYLHLTPRLNFAAMVAVTDDLCTNACLCVNAAVLVYVLECFAVTGMF
jgi:hypothetical protein